MIVIELRSNFVLGAFVLLEEPVKMKRWGFRNCQIDRLPVKCKSMQSRVFDEMMVAMKNHITSNSALEEIDLRDNLLHQTDYEHMLQVQNFMILILRPKLPFFQLPRLLNDFHEQMEKKVSNIRQNNNNYHKDLQKSGRFEKLLGFARSHSIVPVAQ